MKPGTEQFNGDVDLPSLLNNLQAGVTLIGPDFRVRMANLAQGAFFNKDPRKLVGRLCHEAFEKRKKVCPHCPGVKAMATGQPCEVDTQGVRDDGSKFPVRIKAFPVRDASGMVDGFIEMVEDVSLRQRAELELGLKNALLRSQMEVSPDGILVVDPQGRMVSFNKKFVEMWDIPDKIAQSRSDEKALKSVLDKLVDPKAFLARVRHLYNHPSKSSHEELFLKDGRIFDRRSEPMVGPDGAHYGRAWFFRDISDSKRAEASLRESEEKFRSAFEFAKDAILWGDAETGVIVNCNKAAEDLLGRPRTEIVGMHQTRVHPPELKENYRRHFRRHAKARTAQDDQAEIVTASGRIIPVSISAKVLELGGRQVVQGIFRDISSIRQANAERGLLIEVSRIFREEGSLEEACSRISFAIAKTLGLAGCAILQPLHGGKEARVLGISGNKGPYRPGAILPGRRTLTSLVLRTSGEVAVKDCRSEKSPHFSVSKRLGLRSLLCVPVRIGREIAATIGIGAGTVRDDLDRLAGVVRAVGSSLAAELKRRRAEASLKESEERYRLIVETSTEGIGALDRRLVITFANDRFCAMLGYAARGLVGLHLRRIFFPEDWEFVLKRMALRREGKNETYESRFKRKDGSACWLHVSGAPMRDSQGRFAGAFAMFTDITARKKAESDLLRSEQLYRALAEGIPDFVFLTDPKGRVLYANRKTPQMPDPVGKTQAELFPPKTARKHLSVIRRVVRTGKPSLREETVTWSGRPTVFENRLLPLRGGDGRVARLLGLTRDISERRRTESSLKASEARYRNIVEGLRQEHFFYQHDTRGVFTYLSPSIKDILGYTVREFLAHYSKHLTDHPVNQEVRRHTDLSIKGIPQPPYLVQIFHKDGSRHWLRVLETPVRGPQGEVVAVDGMAQDITGRMKMEESLRASEERFKTLIESSGMAIAVLRRGRLILVNKAFARLYRFGSPQEAVGTGIFSLVAPDQVPAMKEQHRRRLAGKPVPRQFESVARRADGSLFPVFIQMNSIRLPDGDAVVGFFRDISQRRKAEEALKSSEKRLRTFFKLSNDAIIIHHDGGPDTRGRIVLANDKAVRRLGYSLKELRRMSPMDLDAPDSGADMPKVFAEMRRKGHVIFEQVHVARNGTRIPVEINAQSFELEGRKMVLSIIRDISERKRSETELKKLRSAVSMSQETERRRLARELHDGVGQILSGIKFSLQALPEDVATAPWDASKHILKAAGMLDKAIAEVRRVSQNLMPSELEDLGLEPALMTLCRGFKERSGVRARVQLDHLPKTLGRDASLAVYRVAQEALANVERHAQASSVDLLLRRRKNLLELSVTDDGRGCSSERRRRRAAQGGLGLGNIADRVNALGGRMEFDSTPGKGTRLTVAVPMGNGGSNKP